jgi:hypothetical protein
MGKKPRKRFLEMGKNSESGVGWGSQRGDDNNLELSESLRAAIEKLAASKLARIEESALQKVLEMVQRNGASSDS